MHVGITDKLIDDVRDRIWYELRTRNYRVEFGVDDIKETFTLPKDHPAVAKILWGEHAHLEPLMPADWCDKLIQSSYDNYMSLQLRSQPLASDGSQIHITLRLVGDKDLIVKIPPKGRSNVHTIPFDLCPEITKYFEAAIKESEFDRKWCDIRSDVAKFLDSSKSLNAALKAWPELRAFIPDKYLKRVEAKAERHAAKEKLEQTLAEIDRDKAVAAATIAMIAA
jgi:hypothetical protein